jgi:hypothetical protein
VCVCVCVCVCARAHASALSCDRGYGGVMGQTWLLPKGVSEAEVEAAEHVLELCTPTSAPSKISDAVTRLLALYQPSSAAASPPPDLSLIRQPKVHLS